jgi:hypothetical protein
MRWRILMPLLLAVTVLLPNSAAAWHKHGHMAVARVAWKQLDDKQKVKLSIILKAHPHYDLFLKDLRPNGMAEAEWVFVHAATWPD